MKWKIIIIDLGQIKKKWTKKVIQIKSSCELLMKWMNEVGQDLETRLKFQLYFKDN